MARVGYVATRDAEGEAGVVLEKMEKRGSAVLNLHRAIANSPNSLRNYLRLGNSLLLHGLLPPVLRELAILRIARITGAGYEWAHHVPIAKQTGVRDEQIADIETWRDSPHFDDRERAVLRYIETVTSEIAVPDEVFQEARSHLSEGEVVELALVAGYWGMTARLLVALQIDLEPPFERYLPE